MTKLVRPFRHELSY